MSLFVRALRRPAAPRFRTFSASVTETAANNVPTAATSPYIAQLEAVEHHAVGTSDLWRKISYYICVPAIIVCAVWTQKIEAEHVEHTEHLKKEHGGHLPEQPQYDYLNRRVKPFPWGVNSLFYNPHVNKDMSE